MKRIKEKTELEIASDELFAAIKELDFARENFNNAENQFVDLAIMALELAEKKVRYCSMRTKMLG